MMIKVVVLVSLFAIAKAGDGLIGGIAGAGGGLAAGMAVPDCVAIQTKNEDSVKGTSLNGQQGLFLDCLQ